MDEQELKATTAYLRSEYPAPSEAYEMIARALEALWAQNEFLRERVRELSLNAATRY